MAAFEKSCYDEMAKDLDETPRKVHHLMTRLHFLVAAMALATSMTASAQSDAAQGSAQVGGSMDEIEKLFSKDEDAPAEAVKAPAAVECNTKIDWFAARLILLAVTPWSSSASAKVIVYVPWPA